MPERFAHLRAALAVIGAAQQGGRLGTGEHAEVLASLGGAATPGSLLGLVLKELFGGAGDVELIDRLCCGASSSDPAIGRWESFVHSLPIAQAYRQRTSCFVQLVTDAIEERRTTGTVFRVLSLGGAPGREIAELLGRRPDLPVRVSVVEPNQDAAAYAASLLSPFKGRVTLVRQSALLFVTSNRFDLIWFGGLLDWLTDKAVVAAVARSVSHLAPGGQVLMASLQDAGGKPGHMDLMGRRPMCRPAGALRFLAEQANVPRRRIAAASHPAGTLEFLRIDGAAAPHGGLGDGARPT